MALVRGVQSLHPCPVCLVKAEEQSDLTVTSPCRNTSESKNTVERARSMRAEEREALLKSMGLRNVDVTTQIAQSFLCWLFSENVFWQVENSDPYQALSFDRLHSHHSGLWGDHLFSQIKLHIKSLEGRQDSKLDMQYALVNCLWSTMLISHIDLISCLDGVI